MKYKHGPKEGVWVFCFYFISCKLQLLLPVDFPVSFIPLVLAPMSFAFVLME
jgi:hypothetical protein